MSPTIVKILKFCRQQSFFGYQIDISQLASICYIKQEQIERLGYVKWYEDSTR